MYLETRLQATQNSWVKKLHCSFNDKLVLDFLSKNINLLKEEILLCKVNFLLLSKVLSHVYDYLCNIWTQKHSKLAFTVEKNGWSES